jgi:hypothetical protein
LHHLSFSFGLCIICPFLLAQKKSTDDTKAKTKGQMIQSPKEKRQIIQMPKEKDR